MKQFRVLKQHRQKDGKDLKIVKNKSAIILSNLEATKLLMHLKHNDTVVFHVYLN